MKKFLVILALALGVPAIVQGDEAATRGFFASIAGEWQGEGEVLGTAAVQRARWEPALGAAFFRFAFDNRMVAVDGKESRFRAEAFYRVGADGAVTGTWLDSRGMTLPLTGALDESGALVVQWGSAETEQGRSTYRLAGDALEITDEVLGPEGAWRIFGRSILRRAP